MKNIIKVSYLSIFLMIFSVVPSKAFIMDVWELRGVTGEEVSKATLAFKEKAMAGGAKYTAFRSSTKIRGDDPLDTTFVHAYYDSYEDQMATQVLIGQNPDWFASTYGELEFTEVDNITWANDLPVGEVAAGQTVAYAMIEITSGINFLLNFPEMQKKMQELGAPVQVASASCAMCGADVLPTNAMVYFSAANPVDMGKGIDIFASDEMQRWMFAHIAPHANFTDQGIVVFNN